MAKARVPARKPSSKCSKHYPCTLKVNGQYLTAQVKTYSKYGKPEFVLTDLPANVQVLPSRPGSKRRMSTIGGKAHQSALAKRLARSRRQITEVEFGRARSLADAMGRADEIGAMPRSPAQKAATRRLVKMNRARAKAA